MRKNFGSKEFLFPMPVFIIGTYDENENPDAMNAAWGSIGDTSEIFICLSPEHKTVKNILLKKAFTVSMGTASKCAECDYVGLVSENTVSDKLKKIDFHTTKSTFVDAPIINELPMTLECELTSYDESTGHLFGKIINVSADESILGENGKIDSTKLEPISYDPINHLYNKLGTMVGKAFNIGKKFIK